MPAIPDRELRALWLAAGEDLVHAAREGRWADALAAVETVCAELRARAMTSAPASLEVGRLERLTRAERGAT